LAEKVLAALWQLQRRGRLPLSSPAMSVATVSQIFLSGAECTQAFAGCAETESSDKGSEPVAVFKRDLHKVEISAAGRSE
jgi:hypothetical protein